MLSFACVKLSMGGMFGMLLLVIFFANTASAYAQTVTSKRTCTTSDQAYTIRYSDTLSQIATHYRLKWQTLETYNKIANPNLVYVGDILCIPDTKTQVSTTLDRGNLSSSNFAPAAIPIPPISKVDNNPATAAVGNGNPFPYGQCTWWADQRYYQLHGVYVPWMRNANAWQWTTGALQFGWRVSGTPTVGAIMDMQPNVQGASYLGHVAVVEQVLGDGHVIASSMNWGADPSAVTDFQFTPGAGITFITR